MDGHLPFTYRKGGSHLPEEKEDAISHLLGGKEGVNHLKGRRMAISHVLKGRWMAISHLIKVSVCGNLCSNLSEREGGGHHPSKQRAGG